jgi:arabinose-5-phosphate isomerase
MVLDKEIAGLTAVRARLDERFTAAVDLIHGCEGRVIVCGLGKSGLVARKIAATLTSTGTRSLFLHPVEAAHGDLGILSPEDLLLVVSKSGTNGELAAVLEACERLQIPIVSLTGDGDSSLAHRSDVVVDCSVPEEACSLNLAPTASTTAAMAIGDALAVALLNRRGWTAEHFARSHPSGVLGRRLVLTVAEIMHRGDAVPRVPAETSLRDALVEITRLRMGCVFVVNGEVLTGIITDGDLRRLLVTTSDVLEKSVGDLSVAQPQTIRPEALVVQALRKMEENPSGAITQLAVTDADHRLLGAIHIHDIVRLGLATGPAGRGTP